MDKKVIHKLTLSLLGGGGQIKQLFVLINK